MQFDTKEAVKTWDYLKKMQEEGNSFASYLEGKPLTKNSISCFKGIYEAAEHSFEHTTDSDRYRVCKTKDLVQSLDNHLRQAEVRHNVDKFFKQVARHCRRR
jgi:hypothetical protein